MIYLTDHVRLDYDAFDSGTALNIHSVPLEYVRHMLLHNEFRTSINDETLLHDVGRMIFGSPNLRNTQEKYCPSDGDVILYCDVTKIGLSVTDFLTEISLEQ